MTNRIMIVGLIFCLLLCPFTVSIGIAQPSYEEYPSDLSNIHSNMNGEGTETNPYIITNVYELQAMSVNTSTDQYYELSNNIDASATENWDPDNDGTKEGFKPVENYEANLDGNNYRITDLYINRGDEDYVGLVKHNNGRIVNLGIKNGNITGNNVVGSFAGQSTGLIDFSYSDSDIKGDNYVGGIVAVNDGSPISHSMSEGSVQGETEYVGSIVGQNYSEVNTVYSTSDVSITSESGRYIGGVAGANLSGTINNAYSEGDVNVSNSHSVGGIAGYGGGYVQNVYYAGTVTNPDGSDTGVILGVNDNSNSDYDNIYWDSDKNINNYPFVGTETETLDSSNISGLSTSQMQGDSAQNNMNFDYTNTWTTQDSDYPKLQDMPTNPDLVTGGELPDDDSFSLVQVIFYLILVVGVVALLTYAVYKQINKVRETF